MNKIKLIYVILDYLENFFFPAFFIYEIYEININQKTFNTI